MSSDADRGRSPPSGVVPDLGRVGHVLRGAAEREHGIPFTSFGRGGRFRGGIGAVRRIGAEVGSVHRTRHGPSRVLRTGRAAEMRCGIAPDPGAGRDFRPCRRASRCHRERRAPRAFGEGVHACRIKERGQKGHPWWWVRGGRRPRRGIDEPERTRPRGTDERHRRRPVSSVRPRRWAGRGGSGSGTTTGSTPPAAYLRSAATSSAAPPPTCRGHRRGARPAARFRS